MSIADKLTEIAENVPKVFEAGRQELLSIHPEKTVSGSLISVDDVSELPHDVKCKVSGVDNPESVTVIRYGENLLTGLSPIELVGDGVQQVLFESNAYEGVNTPCALSVDVEVSDVVGSSSGNFIYLAVLFKNGQYQYITLCGNTTTTKTVKATINASDDYVIRSLQIVKHARWTGGKIRLSNYHCYESKNSQTLTPSADGTVEGMTSVYPQMNIFTNNADAVLDVTYRQSAGKKAEYDAFWDDFQQNGERKYYMYAFAYRWGKSYNPKYPLEKMAQCTYMFYYSQVTDTLVDIDVSGLNISSMFESATQLHTIRKIIMSESITMGLTSAFKNASSLKNITIEGIIGNSINFQWCPLTKESITSVVNALSSTTTGQTVTFKKTAKEAAFTDDEWSALIANKTNWTFSLV